MRRVNRNNACASNRLIFDFFRIRDLWAKVRGKGESGKEKMPKIIWASQSWFILLRIVKIVKISIRSPLVIFDVSSSAKFISSSSLSSYFDSNGHISIHTPVFDQVEFDILSFSRRCPWKYISKCVLLSIFYSENMPIVFTHWTRTKREREREKCGEKSWLQLRQLICAPFNSIRHFFVAILRLHRVQWSARLDTTHMSEKCEETFLKKNKIVCYEKCPRIWETKKQIRRKNRKID